MSGLEWAFLIGYLAFSLVGGCIGMLYLLELIDYPRSEEGWRIELYNTHGLERDTILTSYRFHHRKQLKELKRKRKEDGKKKSARRKMADGESLSASGSASMDPPDSGLREHQQKLRDDANHHKLFCGNPESEHEHSEGFQGSTGRNAAPEKPTPSSRPAHKHRENRSSSSAGSSEDLSDASGNGGRAGGMIDDFDSPFWKKLVTHAEELGL